MTQHDFLSGVHPNCSVSTMSSLLGSPPAPTNRTQYVCPGSSGVATTSSGVTTATDLVYSDSLYNFHCNSYVESSLGLNWTVMSTCRQEKAGGVRDTCAYEYGWLTTKRNNKNRLPSNHHFSSFHFHRILSSKKLSAFETFQSHTSKESNPKFLSSSGNNEMNCGWWNGMVVNLSSCQTKTILRK